MAELLSLEEDLTCCICLSPFECPVTIPCGHNFCHECLQASWSDGAFCCPQCRTFFSTKPELKKNTVLSTVVETFSSLALPKVEVEVEAPGGKVKVEKENAVICDSCMEVEASRTCLTCMASFCEEHLKPHQMNPVFSLHQLSLPVGNLLEWVCKSHHKLMEFFCSQHGQTICSLCLQQKHQGCSFLSTEEQRNLKKADFKGHIDFLDKKIVQNQKVIGEISGLPEPLLKSAASSKKAIAAEYQQIRDLLALEEQNALLAVDRELESSHVKLKVLTKKFTANISALSKAKEALQSQLSKATTLAFLQTSFELPQVAKFDPYAPRINLDSANVKQSKTFAASLKKYLTESLKLPPEARLQRLQTAEQEEVKSTPPPAQPQSAAKKKPQKKKTLARSVENLLDFSLKEYKSPSPAAASKLRTETHEPPPDLTSVMPRNVLLKYATAVTLDLATAHQRISVSEGFTKATMAEEALNYPDSPQRFTVCSQVLGNKGLARGRHYWEILLSSNNFIGIGLTYDNIERKGLTSRLGRNSVSWCVEWLNSKLSAWHNSRETVLGNPNPRCVGVLLDCDRGTATFYNVADKAVPFHSFVFPFTKAVYPAFWIFPSGSTVSLRRLQA